MLNMSEQQQEEEEVEEEVSSIDVCLIQESSLCGGGVVVVEEEGAEKEVSSIEVCLIQESSLCGGGVVVQEAEKVRMAQGCSLICVLGRTGALLVTDVTHTEEAMGTTLEGTYSDFSWEEMTVHTGSVSGLRLLAVGSQCALKLFEVEVERSGSTTLVCLCQCPAGSLVQMLKDKDLSVCEPMTSIRMLCFVDGRCCLLLNDSSLLWLKWEQGAGDNPQPLSCCDLPLPTPACQYHLCRGTLFVLSTNRVIYVFDSVEGRQLAMINLPLYMSSGLEEEEQTSSPCPSSFCVLQVSADLSTVVAVSLSHEAVAVDLNHYFRTFPDHLLCRVTSGRPSMRPPEPRDQDSLLSSTWSHHALDTTFTSDRSWEARLSSMYNRAKAGAVPQPPISVPQPWFSDLPHPECLQALSSARLSQSRAPPCGAAVSLSIPDSASLSLLSVSEFSAVLTYVSSNPGEHQATVALWDLQSQSVSYHRADCQAVPVQRCGEQQHSLLLKGSGLVQVLFGVTQEELLNRLMVFGSAATVDALCHLNSWGRCSIPLHALQAGLKNRQLDTVDFFLKSKENILNPAGSSVSDGDTPSQLSTIQELCPALDLLCSSIRDSHSEAQSRQFSEQLLSLALSFLNTQVTTILNNTQVLDADSERCVEILDAYITELRVYMKKFPWTAGGDTPRTHTPATLQQQEEGRKEEQWDLLTTEALVQKAVLTNQIPRVQAFLQRQGRPDQTISDLRCTGLRLVFNCLSNRDLQQAKTLLRNMGFNVKKQLHSVCLYTDDKDLREFVVEELATQGYLSEEEMQRVAFLRQMEVLGSQPTTRCSQLTHTTSVLQLAQSDPGCRVVLEDLMGDSRSQSDSADLWSSLRLDWVRHWDQNSQRTVQLSRVQDTAVASSDPVVLWGYLTSLHDRDRLVCWIQSVVGQNTQPSAAPCWPELTSDLVNNNTHCSRTLREHILYLLARRGMLTKAELSDFDQLLWRMSQAGGVMTAGTPLPPNLHKRFIQFCLDHSLQYLLYTYLQYYRLTPRNCPSLSNRTLSESQPWFDMLVKTQEISRDLTDPECVFWTSLTSAQVVLPGGQASVSSMLLEGHSLLALATIMFTPGGIDQVMRQGDRSGSPAWRVDPQLLKMTLTPYPKLRAALFPAGGPRSNPTTSDLSIYHLMQSLQPLDPSRLFVWQTANTLSPNDVSELPHFSSPELVNRFALMERLDAAYYLRHGRPTSAYVTFLLQNLPGCSDVKTLLCAAAEQAYHVALQSFNVPSVSSACVCFCELLGVCSLKLRVDLRVLIMILHHWTHGNTHISPATHTQNLVAKGNKLLEVEQTAAEELIGYLESAVIDSLEQSGISRTSYEAGQEWAVPVQFCQLHHLPITSVYPAHCAADGHWINFLLFVQLHSYPPQQVRLLATQFGPALQAHLSLAFQELQFNSRQRVVREDEEDEEQEENVKGEVPEPLRELFQVLLQSQEEPRSWTHLLGEALAQRCPLLAILAACDQEAELLQCLCVWLLSSVDDVTATEATAHLEESQRHHSWSLHDLSIIWRGLLGRGHVRPLLRGFQLFQKECVLVHVLQMFELCSDNKNFSQAKNKLLDFQRSLVALRSSVCVTPGGLPVQWVESQASVLLMTMLQRCATRYELHRLLLLLAGMDGLLKSNGPDFKKLSQLSEVLQAGPVCVSSRLLQPCSQQELQTEYQGLVDSLQAAGLFPQARQVAELADLPVDNLLINQLHQEFITQKAKRQWGRREARVCFWRRCHEQFESNGTSPEPAAQFFSSQTEEDDMTPHNSSTQTELLRTQERCVLLSLAGHWLSRVDPVPLPRLRLLEKCLWTNRIRERVLLRVSMETESIFSLPFPPLSAVSSEETDSSSFSSLSSWYEVLVNEQFCFSKISALNQESDLTLDGLPQEEAANHDSVGKEKGDMAEICGNSDSALRGHGESALSSEERGVLSELIGQLLDEGRVHEASRVCRYFSYYHSDMRVVLHCRGLASGELRPGTQEVTEAPPGRSLTTSPSVSSLLSFDLLPPPDDQVLCQLKTLVNSCRHGNNYCKQVLSLYELSKELDCSFDDLYKEDPQAVLSQVLMSSQPERYQKAQAFIKVQNLQPNTVAQLVANGTVQGILASTQDTLAAERQVYRPSEGRDSFVQLAKLCGDPNLVGLCLLDLLSTVPLSKLDCIVEVLIVVHDCFSLSCNMEGIVRVLQAARHLSHAHLAPSEQYGLLVRLLTGIGRYNEMTYIFDLLHQNHRFEILLRKNVDRPPGQSSSLKTALLDYIKRCLPGDSEKHNMVALCFSMRREIGENHEMAARTQLKIIESQPWVVTPELEKSLSKVFDLLKDAAESYSKDQCVRQASRCVRMAKLVLLQRHFLKDGSQQRIINLRQADLAIATQALPRCYQVFVVSEAYDYSPDWAELVYQKVLVNGDFQYLEELKRHRPLTSSLFEDVSKKWTLSRPAGSSSQNLRRFLRFCDDVSTLYRLAYQHQLTDLANLLLQDCKSSSYLTDRLAN